MRLGSLALWIVISVALVIVGEAEPLSGLEEDEDEADNDEEENGENDPHDHSYCLTSQCVPEGKEKSQFALFAFAGKALFSLATDYLFQL